MSIFDTLNFQALLITDVFVIEKGKRLIKSDREAGETPFISSSALNNGVTDFSDVDPLFCGGKLTLAYDGSIGETFYQPVPFYALDTNMVLTPKSDRATWEALLVMATILRHEVTSKYSYAYKFNVRRAKRQTIKVPVITGTEGEQVADWEGMTLLGKELFARVIADSVAARQLNPTSDDSLPDLRFEPRQVTEVFEECRQAPSWLNTNRVVKGKPRYPHVTNSAASNSVSNFIAPQAKDPNPGNTITIGIDTQVVAYQPVPFYGATKVFTLRSPYLNETNAPILMTALKKSLEKFSWGYKASAARLKRTRIMVPVTTDKAGKEIIDWDGMNRYGLALRARTERRLDQIIEPSPRTRELNSIGGKEHSTLSETRLLF